MTVSATAPIAELIVVYVVFGIGFGFVNPPISNTAVSGMPPAQSGVAASIASTCRQVGATLGVAVIGSLVAGPRSGRVHGRQPRRLGRRLRLRAGRAAARPGVDQRLGPRDGAADP